MFFHAVLCQCTADWCLKTLSGCKAGRHCVVQTILLGESVERFCMAKAQRAHSNG